MSQEHANSYTVDTGGYKRVMANIRGDKGYESKTNKFRRHIEAIVDLQNRVKTLEHYYHANNHTRALELQETCLTALEPKKLKILEKSVKN